MSKLTVAVLRGGKAPAYEDSLQTGAHVLNVLNSASENYEPLDIFISRDGEWHSSGLVEEPHKILSRADVVWNALHGPLGEDGEVAKLLEKLRVPFVGSGIASSALAHNKDLAKNVYKLHNLLTPQHTVLTLDDLDSDNLIKVFQSHLMPVVVKPVTGVRALGIRLAKSFGEMKEAVADCFRHSPKVLVEEYIPGTVSTCTVIEKGKGEALYTLLPTHFETEFRRVRPTFEQNQKIAEMAKEAHGALGLRHHSSSDFIVTPRGKIYILETNSNPVFHPDSTLARSLEASGWKNRDFVEHNLKLALGEI